MSADFWAGYISGAAGIIIGNPLDLIKVRMQAGVSNSNSASHGPFESIGALVRGGTSPELNMIQIEINSLTWEAGLTWCG